MALVVKDRVQVSTSTTGTGTLTLGAALGGFQDFSVIGDGNTTYYTITNNGNWEVGIGTYTSSGNTLSRDTVLESSNSGNKINLSGTSVVFCTYPAEKSVDIETAQTLTNKTINGSNNTITNVSLTTGVTGILPESNGGTGTSAGNQMFKNRIINGAMMIDQRNAGASVTPTNGQYTLDRWLAGLTQASKFSVQQNAGSVTPPAGFTNYLGITSLSAYSVGTSDIFVIRQYIEGFNAADLGWGTANAQTVTLSFWVRSSLTGTFGGVVNNRDSNRSYPFSYTISSANTWEYKTVTIAGDTSGTWYKNNDTGVKVQFGLGVGSTYSGTAGAWAGAEYYSATGATSVVGTSGATFYITGVQLEKGSTATSFDYRPYGTELQLCQRYFELCTPDTVNGRSATAANAGTKFVVTKRSAPSVTAPYATSVSVVGATTVYTSTGTLTIAIDGSSSISSVKVIATAGTSWGLGASGFYDPTYNATTWFGASAEL